MSSPQLQNLTVWQKSSKEWSLHCLHWHCPIELSVVVDMFCTCAPQSHGHLPHVAMEPWNAASATNKLNFKFIFHLTSNFTSITRLVAATSGQYRSCTPTHVSLRMEQRWKPYTGCTNPARAGQGAEGPSIKGMHAGCQALPRCKEQLEMAIVFK